MSKKDLADVCNYMKALVIPDMPDGFRVADKFRHGLTDREIRKGVGAYRGFLYALFDKLAADKDKIDLKTRDNYNPYVKSDRTNIRMCLPVIVDLAMILFTLGIRGRLDMEGKRLAVRVDDLLTVICEKTENYISLIKMSGGRKFEMFRILTDLGLGFEGVDFSREVDFSKVEEFSVTYAADDFFVAGLKLLAEATANHRDYYYVMNMFGVLLECDFYPLANEKPKKRVRDINLSSGGQATEIREWIAEMDGYLLSNGCTLGGSWEFTYALRKVKNRKGMVLRVWMDITGCYACPGVNHLDRPDSIVSMLPGEIVEMLKTQRECGWCSQPDPAKCSRGGPFGFTHDGGEYVRCRTAEFRIDLSDAGNRDLVRQWVEMELAASA